MPVIEAKCIERVFSEKEKKELLERLTDAVVAVEGDGMRPFTYVLIEETKEGDRGIGGQPMTAATVHAATKRGPARTG